MELTTKQEEGLKIAIKRYRMGYPYTVISGYAGAGKSTLVKFITSALNIPEDQIAYVAYTGKAANVLKQKGCPNPTTAHKLLYYAKQMPSGHYVFKPKPLLDEQYKLIVVDEVSMLPNNMWDLLLSHGVYVLACGDPGQLPPIDKDQINNVLDHPHIFLDEIMRQAQDSAIIRLSMHIRDGKDFRTFPTATGEVRVVPSKYTFSDQDSALLQASQIICSTNRTRTDLNNRVRLLQGRGAEPEVGDKIIGLKNHWDCFSNQMNALTNGAIGNIITYQHQIQNYPSRLDISPTDLIYTNMKTEDEDLFINLPIDYKGLMTGDPAITPKQEYKLAAFNKQAIAKCKKFDREIDPNDLIQIPFQFAYGYAITCWKAQGSEWPYVLGYDAPWLKNKNKDEYIQYLYTLVTRAQKAVILVGD